MTERIRIDHIEKRYPGLLRPVKALRGVNFTVNSREIVGLVGPNGSGKSTLLRTIVGLLKPDNGIIYIDGMPSTAPHARSHIGFVPENPSFPPGHRLKTYLHYHLRLINKNPKEEKDRIQNLLQWLNLDHDVHRIIGQFSRGMKQKVAFICAILNNPEILILDEPVSGMDPGAIIKIRQYLSQLRNRGGCALVSSHLLDELVKVCDRIVFIKEGTVVREWDRQKHFHGYRIDLEFETPVSDIPALHTILQQDYILEHHVDGHRLQIVLKNRNALNELLKELVNASLPLTHLGKPIPDLEKIFLEVFGP